MLNLSFVQDDGLLLYLYVEVELFAYKSIQLDFFLAKLLTHISLHLCSAIILPHQVSEYNYSKIVLLLRIEVL